MRSGDAVEFGTRTGLSLPNLIGHEVCQMGRERPSSEGEAGEGRQRLDTMRRRSSRPVQS